MLFDIRCRDVARFVASGPKTVREIGEKIHELYPEINSKGRWVKDILIGRNPFIKMVDEGKYGLSDLGMELVKLPGKEGEKLTNMEKVFLLEVLMLDDVQRRIACELIVLRRSRYGSKWAVNLTKRILKELNIL